MMSDLAEVDNYKIRLITKDELMDNLGFTVQAINTSGDTAPKYTENTAIWVYSNYGENQNNVYGYWTMTPDENGNSQNLGLPKTGVLSSLWIGLSNYGVRPIINLLKSVIPAQ